MKNQNTIKLILIIASLCLTSEFSTAQSFTRIAKKYQFGPEATFGIKSYQLSSNISAINKLNVAVEGGTVGFTVGSHLAKLKIRQCYYYSTAATAISVDQVSSAGIVNFYPLQLFSKNESLLQPYLTLGIERNILKMYGFYGNENPASANYSSSEAPYLGKMVTLQSSVGLGVEYRLITSGNFVSLFSEARFGKTVGNVFSSPLFQRTTTGGQLLFAVGISFGYHE